MTPRRYWSAEEEAVLRRDYPDMPTRELAARLGLNHRALYRKAAKLGIRKSPAFMAGPLAFPIRHSPIGIAHRFQPGHPAWNKGRKGLSMPEGCRRSQFKRGDRPWCWRPIGSERLSKEGYRVRKVTDHHGSPRDWVPVHVLLWRERHGPVPPHHAILFIDGDRTHLDIANLACVPRAVLAYLNKHGYHQLAPALRPSAIALARLAAESHRRQRACA